MLRFKKMTKQVRTTWYQIVAVAIYMVIGFLFVHTNAIAATIPAIITYQGKVLTNNIAVSSTLPMKFVIYTAPSAGSAVYTAAGTVGTPTTVSITPTSGIFSIDLGGAGTNSIDPTIFQNNASLYLEVTINGETLSPRKQLTAAPYAFNAQYLNGYMATSTPITSTAYIPLTDSGGNLSINNVTTTKIRLTNGIVWGTGNYTGVTNTIPTITVGPQLMWIPEMAAFRAGYNTSPLGVPKWGPLNVGSYSASFGNANYASGDYSISAGFLSTAGGFYSTAFGYQATASGQASVALGGISLASGSFSFATGYLSFATGDFSEAIGQNASSTGSGALALGNYVLASGVNSHTLGTVVTSSGQNATALGSNIEVLGAYSLGIGLNTTPAVLTSPNTFAVVGGQSLFGTTTAPGTAYRVFIDGGTSTNPGLGVNGYIKASGFITGTTTLDLAEVYPVDSSCSANGTCPEAGDAVCVSGTGSAIITKCTQSYSPNVLGVISTDPGFTLGGLGDSGSRKLALAGRVPLKVVGNGDPIKAGDHLTTSNIPGVAKKAIQDGPVIGIALEDDTGQGTVLTLVRPQWWWPSLESILGQQDGQTPPVGFMESLSLWLHDVGISFVNGAMYIKEIVVEKITGDSITARQQLCVGATCVTESDLQRLLNQPGSSANNIISPALTPLPQESSLPADAMPAPISPTNTPVENSATSSP